MTHANQIRAITQGHACKHIQAEGITVFVNQDGEDISAIVRNSVASNRWGIKVRKRLKRKKIIKHLTFSSFKINFIKFMKFYEIRFKLILN